MRLAAIQLVIAAKKTLHAMELIECIALYIGQVQMPVFSREDVNNIIVLECKGH